MDLSYLKKSEEQYYTVLNHYQQRHTKSYGTPLIMSFLITNRCNLRCKHCFYHKTLDSNDLTSELTILEYEKISKSMDWFLTGIFCGGEPFIREDFHEIVRIFQKNNRIITADSATNGQLTDSIVRQTESILKGNKYQNFTLGLSLEGFEEQHDSIRGIGTFRTALNTWKELKHLERIYKNFFPYICSTINAINQATLCDFFEWCTTELSPNKISLLKIRQEPRDGLYLKDINPLHYKKCADYITSQLSHNPQKIQAYILPACYQCVYKTIRAGEKTHVCYAGKHGGFIDFDGTVSACEILPPIGNLKEYDYNFGKLWNSISASKIRNLINLSNQCKACTHESESLLPSISFPPNNKEIKMVCEMLYAN